MTDAEIAAKNDKVMGDFSICHDCAKANGGYANPYMIATTWMGTCISCEEVKDCFHVRDFGWPGGVKPRKAEVSASFNNGTGN